MDLLGVEDYLHLPLSPAAPRPETHKRGGEGGEGQGRENKYEGFNEAARKIHQEMSRDGRTFHFFDLTWTWLKKDFPLTRGLQSETTGPRRPVEGPCLGPISGKKNFESNRNTNRNASTRKITNRFV